MQSKGTGLSYGKMLAGLAAVLAFILIVKLPTPQGLTPQGQRALAYMVAAIILWVFEVIPIAVSSALLVMLMGLLKVYPLKDAMASFMYPTILFIFSAFIIANAFINTGLGRRISLRVSAIFGQSSDRVLLSFMLPTALISTVLADIPTSIIFASIAYPLLQKNGCEPGKSRFGTAVMIGIPIAAAIGGFGTPAGSGLNVQSIDLLRSTAGVSINFLQWSVIGLPLAIILTLIAWYIILKVYPPEFKHVKGLEDLDKDRQELGSLNAAEKKFIAIFSITLILWFTQPWTKIDTAVVAIVTAAIFFLPGIDILRWDDVKGKIGWDALFLLGAANSLAMAIWQQKGATWLANTVLGGLAGAGVLTILFAVVAFGIFSHLLVPVGGAVVAVAIPVLAALAHNTGLNPALLAIPIGFTASCVFLLPLDPIPLTTYQYKYWTFWDMMKPGFIIALVWLVLMVFAMYAATLIGII